MEYKKSIVSIALEFGINAATTENAVNILKAMQAYADQEVSKVTRNWISTSDKLPEYDEFVLWITEEANYFIREIDKDDHAWWNGERLNTNEKGAKFTHWHPLPSPPNQTTK